MSTKDFIKSYYTNLNSNIDNPGKAPNNTNKINTITIKGTKVYLDLIKDVTKDYDTKYSCKKCSNIMCKFVNQDKIIHDSWNNDKNCYSYNYNRHYTYQLIFYYDNDLWVPLNCYDYGMHKQTIPFDSEIERDKYYQWFIDNGIINDINLDEILKLSDNSIIEDPIKILQEQLDKSNKLNDDIKKDNTDMSNEIQQHLETINSNHNTIENLKCEIEELKLKYDKAINECNHHISTIQDIEKQNKNLLDIKLKYDKIKPEYKLLYDAIKEYQKGGLMLDFDSGSLSLSPDEIGNLSIE